MCGIVGLFLKDRSLEPQLGEMLTDMLITMTDRGPDQKALHLYARPRDPDHDRQRTCDTLSENAGFPGHG